MPKSRAARDGRPIATLDCETDPFKAGRIPQPFIWGCYRGDTEEYWQFDTADAVADFLRSKKWIVYAHNGGKFDYHYLREHMNSDEPFMVISQRIAKFQIGECEFRDSMNLLPVSLATFEKQKIDYSLMEPGARDKPENRRLIELYLQSDCVNLYTFVKAFIDQYGMHLTQAGAAMRYWSKTFERDIPRQSSYQYERLRPFYYGGRVQCFAEGYSRENFSVVDINSAYPYAMLSKHPYSVDYMTKAGLPKGDKLGPQLVRLKAISKGALPMRGADGGLYFPCDERKVREYWATGWEVRAGLETGTLQVKRIEECHVFGQLIDFKEYVAHFYEMRKQAKAAGDKATDIFAKIFLNSLYGKFASNPEKYHEQVIASADSVKQWESEGYFLSSEWGERYLMQRPLPLPKKRYYNIATAASITGYVRAHLWRSLVQCEGPIYCDTDSIAARDVSRLSLGGELGQWKLELECDEYAIAGKKLYAFHERGEPQEPYTRADGKEHDPWKTASKGVDLTAAQIVRVAKGNQVEYSPEVPTYSIHRGSPVFTGRKVQRTYKDISRYDDHRTNPRFARARVS